MYWNSIIQCIWCNFFFFNLADNSGFNFFLIGFYFMKHKKLMNKGIEFESGQT